MPLAGIVTPAAPDARIQAVSFVLVWSSTVTALKLRSVAPARSFRSTAGETRASVVRYASIVACIGRDPRAARDPCDLCDPPCEARGFSPRFARAPAAPRAAPAAPANDIRGPIIPDPLHTPAE